jgi:hypothetical protein
LNSTALVNARPLRTHHWSGVGTCLKNYIQFVPEPSSYHDEGCSPHRKGKDPPEYPQLPHTPILRKGSQFFRQEIRLAVQRTDRWDRSRSCRCSRCPSPSDKTDRIFRRRPGSGRSSHPYRGGR